MRVLACDGRVLIATATDTSTKPSTWSPRTHPTLHAVVDQGLKQGWGLVCLDGTLLASTRCGAPCATGHDPVVFRERQAARREHPRAHRPHWLSSGSAMSNPARHTTSLPPSLSYFTLSHQPDGKTSVLKVTY